MLELIWSESETGEPQAVQAYTPGYELTVMPGPSGGAWFWRVDLTAEISEWPEVLACDFTETLDEAKAAATAAVSRSLARRETRRILKENA